MKASKQDVKYYFAIRDLIHKKLLKDGTLMCRDELNDFLKWYSDLENVSLSNISHDDLQILKESTKYFAHSIGLHLDKDEKIDLNFEIS